MKVTTMLIERLLELKTLGVSTFVDPCPIELGRNPELAAEVAEATGMHIICATGLYTNRLGILVYFRQRSIDEIAEIFKRELTEGIGSSGIRAGLIKCATGLNEITRHEEKCLRAAGRAHKATGAPILTHTESATMGNEQLDILASEGVTSRGSSSGIPVAQRICDITLAWWSGGFSGVRPLWPRVESFLIGYGLPRWRDYWPSAMPGRLSCRTIMSAIGRAPSMHTPRAVGSPSRTIRICSRMCSEVAGHRCQRSADPDDNGRQSAAIFRRGALARMGGGSVCPPVGIRGEPDPPVSFGNGWECREDPLADKAIGRLIIRIMPEHTENHGRRVVCE